MRLLTIKIKASVYGPLYMKESNPLGPTNYLGSYTSSKNTITAVIDA